MTDNTRRRVTGTRTKPQPHFPRLEHHHPPLVIMIVVVVVIVIVAMVLVLLGDGTSMSASVMSALEGKHSMYNKG